MGRPRLHDDSTRIALLQAGERLLDAEGAEAVSVRRIAEEVGTTTRAVYSVFGSKQGLLTALGVRAFELLGSAVDAVPITDDPVADLVSAGATAFRDLARAHPALFRLAIQQVALPAGVAAGFSGAAADALQTLHHRLLRVGANGGLGGRTVADAALEFHALCEGLAAVEGRCAGDGEHFARLWTDALSALVRGWTAERWPPAGPVASAHRVGQSTAGGPTRPSGRR